MSETRRDHVLREVRDELAFQDRKWGTIAEGNNPSWDERHIRVSIAGEEFGEASKAVLENDPGQARAEWVQVAAVAVANIERIDFAFHNTLPTDECPL